VPNGEFAHWSDEELRAFIDSPMPLHTEKQSIDTAGDERLLRI
jgi:hypothetical protein